ncbi:MAG: hypothetical protein KGY67_00500 [Candidatus Thermoplasmatota archaeon]|nr:hypothetical protein [Candidatus Thermoplasmatota archaeon]
MKVNVKDEFVGNIRSIEHRDDLQLVTDSQDVDAIKDYFGNPDWMDEFGGCFVNVKEGDYDEVYCFNGNVPYLDKSLFKIERELK